MAIDEWTESSELLRISQGWISRAAEEAKNSPDLLLPGLAAMAYRAYGVQTLQTDPAKAAEAITHAAHIASSIFADTSVFMVDYYDALRLLHLSNNNSFEAEGLQRKIIRILELQGELNEHLEVFYVKNLTMLALMYAITNRHSDAEEILKKALRFSAGSEIGEALAIQPQLLLAALHVRKGSFDEAERSLEDAFKLVRRSDSFQLEFELLSLAMSVNFYKKKYDHCMLLYRQLINNAKQFYGKNYSDYTITIDILYLKALRLSGDIKLAKRTTNELLMKHKHKAKDPSMPLLWHELALLHHAERHVDSALYNMRFASRYMDGIPANSNFNPESTQLSNLTLRPFYSDYLDILFGKIRAEGEDEPLINESLMVMQKANYSTTGRSIAIMSQRLSLNNDALGQRLRTEDSLNRRLVLEETRLRSLLNSRTFNDGELDNMLKVVELLGSQLREIKNEISRHHPDFASLVQTDSVSIQDIRAALDETEAVILYHVGDSSSYGWLITRSDAEFFKIRLNHQQLSGMVMQIRKTLNTDLSVKGVGGVNTQKTTTGNDPLLKFDTKNAYALFAALLKPVQSKLSNKHLLIIPSGPLHSIPFGLFLTSPWPQVRHISDYRRMPWVATKYNISIWPSLSSIRVLRQENVSRAAQLPFIGFGDPVFLGSMASNVSGQKKPEIDIDTTVDPDIIRSLEPLPETAGELKEMCQSLGGDMSHLYLGKQATETNVKSAELARFKVIAFSTHGFAAGEIGGMTEPALALTPPDSADGTNEGLLTASEIAQLNTNADWVILSACNTASGDGTKGSESLSGLARAFFYSGSRSLLVSHWPVVSESTKILISKTLGNIAKDPRMGRDEALRQSISELIFRNEPHYAHPIFWAPFMVVGERTQRTN